MEHSLSVWEEARSLTRRMWWVTRCIAERVERREVESLSSLVSERQEICERLDALRQEHGIASWIVGDSADGLPESVRTASREIAEIFRLLLEEDEKIRGKLEEAMAALREDLFQLQRTKEASHLYEGRALSLRGAFVDSMR